MTRHSSSPSLFNYSWLTYSWFSPLLVFMLTVLTGCEDEPRPDLTSHLPMVIEGWIEEGEAPVVIVTHCMNLTDTIASLDQYVEKWARVSIDDGQKKYYLNGRINNDYLPSFVYTTSRLKGKRGLNYTLKVETETDTLEATTTILPITRIDSVKVSRTVNNDTLYQINAFARIDPVADADSYYKFFSQVVNRQRRFYSSFLGTFKGLAYDPEAGYSVSKGIHNTFEGDEKFSPYYQPGDTVYVKLCTLSQEEYLYWRAYESSVSLSSNAFFNVARDCPTIIDGALGYWFGYGAYTVRAIIPK